MGLCSTRCGMQADDEIAKTSGNDWEGRVTALWSKFDPHATDGFVAAMSVLTGEMPGDARALFELGAANDSCGNEQAAEPLYREALAIGLTGLRRRRAAIQLASTLRNLGRVRESIAMLEAEAERTSDELDDAVAAFLSLSMVADGRPREAAALTLTRLATHLPRYQRSVIHYARAITSTATT